MAYPWSKEKAKSSKSPQSTTPNTKLETHSTPGWTGCFRRITVKRHEQQYK